MFECYSAPANFHRDISARSNQQPGGVAHWQDAEGIDDFV
jgi:hypothetical protein